MKKLIIHGGHEISGHLHISGAKNSVVSLIPATMLNNDVNVITNVPDISDVRILIEIMEAFGSKVEFKNEVLTIDNTNVRQGAISDDYSSKLRASYYFMGSMLAKYNNIEISNPGGCIIGSRPIDIHLHAFKRMGVNINEHDGHFKMTTKGLKGIRLFFDFPSVGATANIMIASTLAEGTTTILNAAKEPEIANLADFLISMGANITGAGSDTIIIKGVKSLHGGSVKIIPDRIEAGTYAIIGALLGKNFTIDGIVEKHIESLLCKLEEAGVEYKIEGDSLHINKCKKLHHVNVKTCVYPGFPTDLGQPMSALLTQCEGESIFEETIYENRLRHVPHLNAMGANITAFEKKAIILGPTPLTGKSVRATDLRAGASMLVAGMIASGETNVSNVEHLLRGYEKIVEKLNKVGADIELVDVD